MRSIFILSAALLAGCAAEPPPHDHSGNEAGLHECAFCGELVSEGSIVVWEVDDKPFKSCVDCRKHYDGLIEPRQQAMLDQVKTYRCSGCGAVQTIPADEPATSCCGHTMRRLY